MGEKNCSDSKSTMALLDEIDAILENCAAKDADMDKVRENLDALQSYAPVMPDRDAKTAWAEMAEKYPLAGQISENADHIRPRKTRHPHGNWFMRISGAAACILLLVTLTANALGYNPVRSFLQWSGDIVQVFNDPSGSLELPEGSGEEYTSLRQALDRNAAGDAQCLTWIPEDYALSNVSAKCGDTGKKFTAVFYAERGDLVFVIRDPADQDWTSSLEWDGSGEKTELKLGGTTYVVIQNADYRKAYWDDGLYTYSIRGNITEAELESILKSIEKGT